MSTGKINDIKLVRLVDSGVSQAEVAREFGVSRQAVSKRLQELRGRTAKVVAAKKVEHIVNRKIDAIEQLQEINGHANWLLQHLMKWIKGDEAAIQVLESSARQVNKGTKDEPEWLTEYRFRDPYQTALKAMGEIRGQLKLQLEIFQTLYDVEAVREFQQEVLTAIGEASPEVRNAIIRRLSEKQAIRRAIKFD